MMCASVCEMRYVACDGGEVGGFLTESVQECGRECVCEVCVCMRCHKDYKVGRYREYHSQKNKGNLEIP